MEKTRKKKNENEILKETLGWRETKKYGTSCRMEDAQRPWTETTEQQQTWRNTPRGMRPHLIPSLIIIYKVSKSELTTTGLESKVNRKFRELWMGIWCPYSKVIQQGVHIRLRTLSALETEQTWNRQTNKLIATNARPSETNSQKLHNVWRWYWTDFQKRS